MANTKSKPKTEVVGKELTPEELAAQAAAQAEAEAEAARQAAADAAAAEAEADAAAKLAQEQADRDAATQAARDAALDAAAKEAVAHFPREMRVVNHTGRTWVVRKHIPASSADELITVRDADDLHTLRQNCHAVLQMTDHWKPVEGQKDALRIIEVDEQI